MVKGVHLISYMAVLLMVFVTLPLTSSLQVEIKKLTYNNNGLGTYTFEYETSDGSYRREEGGLVGSPDASSLVVRGEYGYIDSNGKPYAMKYVADANGYRPSIHDDQTRFNDSEDVELRRLFPNEFPQDTIRKSGALNPEHLGRYAELKSYFKQPKSKYNSHFEELVCYSKGDTKVCRIDFSRYTPEENTYYSSKPLKNHVDRRRVYCFMLLCFTEDELIRVVASF